jgi:hypothetical protein
MCFVLYAGTVKPLPRPEWNKEAPDLSVAVLTDQDLAIKTHFTTPEVGYLGSTSGCGCDFPHVILQNGEWPFFPELEHSDPKRDASDRSNRESLVGFLQSTGEDMVELYGVWAGDYEEAPRAREEVPVERLLDSNFCFKERGFYRVKLGTRA